MNLPTETQHPRIETLDSLRAICALCVILFHLKTTGPITNQPFFRHSWMLVDFFFVLSGFVITDAYAARIRDGFSIPRYMALRLARVWPLHMVMLLCFLALELSKLAISPQAAGTMFSPPRELASFVLNIFLIQVFGIFDHVTWNVPSWSIAAELWVYLIAAFLFRYAGRALIPCLIAVAFCCAMLMASWGAPFLNLTHDGSVVRCLFGFSLGSLTNAIVRKRIWQVAGAFSVSFAEVSFIIVAIMAVSLVDGISTLAIPPLFALGVFIFAHQRGAISRLLTSRMPVWLGSISYSLYMTHAFIIGRAFDAMTVIGRYLHIDLIQRVDPSAGGARVITGSEAVLNTALLFTLALIIVVSYGTHRWIEQPCNAWFRKRLSRERQNSTGDYKAPACTSADQFERVS